jgi:hypothetical protein
MTKNDEREQSRVSKKLVIEYYERHKSEYANKADAAYRIFREKLVPYRYSTIYTWLDEHIRKRR